jgi:lysophospholipase L1-like esterase
LILQGGINDLADRVGPEIAARNLHAMIERARRRGLRVAVCDVLPWNRGWPDHETPIRALNERIRSFGVTLLPFHDTLEDPDRPGRMKDEWAHDDGDHPSIAGYRRLGEVAFRLPE